MNSDCAPVQTQVARDHASTLARSHVLVHLKAEDGHIAERSRLLATNTRAISLRAIFQQKETAFARNLGNRLDVCRSATHVDSNDPSGPPVNAAAQIFGIDSECFINIGQNRNCAQIYNRSHHRNPHVGGHDDFLPRTDA